MSSARRSSPGERHLRIRAPASTSNLGPGFDSLGLALGLFLDVEVQPAPRSVRSWTFTGEGSSELNKRSENRIEQALGRPGRRGYRIRVRNRIPVRKGLGSSAAATIAGLAARRFLAGRPLPSRQELLDEGLGLEGHPDNLAPCCLGGFTVAVRTDGKVHSLRAPVPRGLRFVLVLPEAKVLTRAARAALPEKVKTRDALFNLSRCGLLCAAWVQGKLASLPYALDDRLHERVRRRWIPGYRALRKAALQAGALGMVISGSGPTLLAICRRDAEAVHGKLSGVLRREKLPGRVIEVRPDRRGVRWKLV